MQKKFLTKLTAIATAGVFAVSIPSMTVLANDYYGETSQITCEPNDDDIVHGDIETTDGTTYAIQAQGGDGTVEGDVIDKSGTATAGVEVNGSQEGSTIVIQGSIEGFDYGIDGGNRRDADISVGKNINARDIGIYATKQDIDVRGNVSGGAAGIYSQNSEITVGGDVTSDGEVKNNTYSNVISSVSDASETGSGIGIIADNGSNISVDGSVNAANIGIEAKYEDDLEEISDANAIVSVGGDVTAGLRGIYADEAAVTVGGDVTTTNDYSTAIEATVATVAVGGDVTAEGDTSTAIESRFSEIEVTGNVSASDEGISAMNSKVTVGSNVTATGDESTGIDAYSSTVDIGGDVNAKEIGIFAQDSTIDVEGSVDGGTAGAYANDKSNITIDGDVFGTGIAVGALSSTVTINGDVTSDGSEAYGYGDLDFFGTGIATQASRVFVGGNVTARYNGVEIGLYSEEDEYDDENDDTDSETYVVIKGTITAENGIAIAAWDTDNADDVMNALPTLYIYQIASENPIWIGNESMDSDALAALTQTVAKNINYIITSDDAITIDPTSATSYMDFYTTRLNNAFTFTVADGYEFNTNHSDTFTTVYNEATGKWTATLTSVNGGINLTTINPNGGANEEGNNEQNQNENPDNHNDQNGNADNNNDQNGHGGNADDNNDRNNDQDIVRLSADQAPSIENTGFYGAPLGAINVSSGAGLSNAAPAVEGGAAPSRVLSLNVSELTPAQLQTAVVDNISSTPSGGTLRIETTAASCFDQKMLETFAQKGDIDIEVLFTYGGKKLRVVIPAGYDITKLLDEKGYCGYLRLADILGATEV